jgi:hypothetical protein
MHYSDGNKILLGDLVTLGGGMTGVIVCDFEEENFAQGYNKSEWKEFKKGIMVESSQAGLIYYEEEFFDLTLVKRAEIEPYQ